MSYLKIKKAEKGGGFARVALIGPPGSGKSYSSLRMAKGMAEVSGGRVGAIDSERGRLRKYANKFDFDEIELNTFAPETYTEAIQEFAAGGYKVLIIDSLSHSWMGKDGTLQQVEQAAKRNYSGNSYAGWKDATPAHNALVDAILSYPGHVIVTMRSKIEYATEKDERTGKMVVRKIGLAPVQRQDVEFEFDVVGDMTQENDWMISKTMVDTLKREIIHEPDEEVGRSIATWAQSGVFEKPPVSQPDSVLLPIARLMKEKKITSAAVMDAFGKSPRNMDADEIISFTEWLNAVEVPEV